MASDLRQVARLQQLLASQSRVASVVLRTGEPPCLLTYAGTPLPVSNAQPMEARVLQAIAQAAAVPRAGEPLEDMPDFLLRGLEHLMPSEPDGGRFRILVTRNASLPVVVLDIVRPARQLAGILTAFVDGATATPLGEGQDTHVPVTPAEAAALTDDGLVVIDAPTRSLGQLYGSAVLEALAQRPGRGTVVSVQGSPRFDLPSRNGVLFQFEVPGDLDGPLSVLTQPPVLVPASAFYTDMPETLEGHEDLIPRLAGKAVFAVTGGNLRGVEALFRKYGKKNTTVVTVRPRRADAS